MNTVAMVPRWIDGLVVALMVGYVSFMWWRIKSYFSRTDEGIKQLEKSMLQRLYFKDGSPIYISRSECNRVQAGCKESICRKISSLEDKVNEMDRKRESARDEYHERMDKIMTFMGRVEAYLSNDKN